MSDQDQNPGKPNETTPLDALLVSLKRAPMHGPSPALRSRLSELYASSLQERPRTLRAVEGETTRRWWWLAPATAAGLLAAAWMVAMLVMPHHDHQGPLANRHPIQSRAVTSMSGSQTVVPVGSSKVPSLLRRHVHRTPARDVSPETMTVPLPYSNDAIVTGTSTTFRVAMSQYELASLGLPVSGGLGDRRVLAEVTLGADGLPRAVSVPLPLEILKEKR